MAFAVAEINRSPGLLPNLTLGYLLYDTCFTLGVAFRASLSLVGGREERFRLDESCAGSPPVLGIVGAENSGHSIAISSLVGLYRVPMVSGLQCFKGDDHRFSIIHYVIYMCKRL